MGSKPSSEKQKGGDSIPTIEKIKNANNSNVSSHTSSNINNSSIGTSTQTKKQNSTHSETKLSNTSTITTNISSQQQKAPLSNDTRIKKPPPPVDISTFNANNGAIVPNSVDLPTPPAIKKVEAKSDGISNYHSYDSKLSINDFDLLKVLGKGSFGKVMLVKRKGAKEDKLYAMKTLRKAALVKRNQVAHTSTERYILENISCPFLVHLQYAFQTPDKLYMVLDYMGGGELFFWLKRDKKFSENRAKLYAAEISIAIHALHCADIIYRDLKPENILLDVDGHIRLTDFGLAKGGIVSAGPEGGTKTFCGTPEYLAPEILENKGHGKAVDWWALGTFIFEMITGLPPFYDTNVQKMYHRILHDSLKFPKSENRRVSEQAQDLLRRFLERRISDRLGSSPSGFDDIQRTPFFRDIDFKRVSNKQYEPEFKPPQSTSLTDVRNFDQEFTSEQAADSMVTTTMSETMQEKSQFEGFTFQGPSNVK